MNNSLIYLRSFCETIHIFDEFYSKGFSQIVFNDSVNHNKNIHSESISEDEDLPSLSPIGHLKLNSCSSNVDIRSYGLSSLDLPGDGFLVPQKFLIQ